MPLLDSFTVDHTRMNAPAVRVAKTMQTPKGDTVTVFDLRFTAPNKDILCLLYTSPSPRDLDLSRMPSSA